MITIHKYPLVGGALMPGPIDITTDRRGRALHAGLDPNGLPAIWIEVDTEVEARERTVWIAWTGSSVVPIGDGWEHVSSFAFNGLMLHTYIEEADS